jgi:acetyl-CoA C-acetyltransferase
LSLLKPVFKEGGTVTAGNASSINSGAAALLVASEEVATRENMDVFGFLSAYVVTGVEPEIMGMGPVSAMKQALERAGLRVGDIDLFELNEAFAAQTLGVLQEFPLPQEKLNVNGGAIALGHPIGATGAVLLVKLLHELRRRGGRRGMVSLCIGGGMGIAAIVESV